MDSVTERPHSQIPGLVGSCDLLPNQACWGSVALAHGVVVSM